MQALQFASTLSWLGLAAFTAAAQPPVALPGNGMIIAPVRTYTDIRFQNIVRQAFDLSCGAAALATLLKYHYGVETTEKEIIERIIRGASEEQKMKIEKSGFSMLELKRLGESFGFAAGGFRITEIEKLNELRIPALTLTTVRGYSHFVVIKGVRDGIVYIADPAFGNRTRTLDRFAESWNSVVLVFVDRSRQGKSAFTFDDAKVTPTREVVVLTDRVLRTIPRGPGEF